MKRIQGLTVGTSSYLSPPLGRPRKPETKWHLWGSWRLHTLGRRQKNKPTSLAYSSLVYELARGHFCKYAGGCRYFCQEAVFGLSRPTERPHRCHDLVLSSDRTSTFFGISMARSAMMTCTCTLLDERGKKES
jgi:hypothetical protein